MTFILKHTNTHKEVYYFQNLGMPWPHNHARKLIERTTRDRSEARQFSTEEEANETLVIAGNPRGWEVVEL